MTSNKTCIICSNIANSKEHIFPAAFGGRVVNKSIYCSFHNGAFSRHVYSLDKELDILNSAIGVIPDRKNSIKVTRLKDSASEEYVYTKDYMKLASPSALDMAPNSGAEQMQLRFADHMHAQNLYIKPLDYLDVNKSHTNTKVILDLPHPLQNGLTMRTIEAIGANKKLITTNEDIKNYDFYDEDNICILDKENITIEKDFFEKPYKKISKDIKNKYSLDSWIEDVFINVQRGRV